MPCSLTIGPTGTGPSAKLASGWVMESSGADARETGAADRIARRVRVGCRRQATCSLGASLGSPTFKSMSWTSEAQSHQDFRPERPLHQPGLVARRHTNRFCGVQPDWGPAENCSVQAMANGPAGRNSSATHTDETGGRSSAVVALDGVSRPGAAVSIPGFHNARVSDCLPRAIRV